MRITWFGHSCFLVDTGSHRLLFDPWLNSNPSAPVRASQVKCDFIFCSHAHDDHMADALEIARTNQASIVAPYELAEYFAAEGAVTFDPMPGGVLSLPFGEVRATPAMHSSALELGNGQNRPMGEPVGFVVTASGKKLYHAGDTGLFSDMRLIGRLGLDVALVPIGGWYTMGIEDAVDALDLLVPGIAVPMHYNTHPKIAVDPTKFVREAAARGHSVRIVTPGDSFEC